MHLWIALYFNTLPLEVIPGSAAGPRAVLTGQSLRDRVLICNPAAADCGIRPGLSVNAALALAPELEVVSRDPDRETEALEEFAGWAIRFTPSVSIALPDTLLLDVHASLKFFRGFARLRELVTGGLDARGYAARVACAPTAMAALWFARAGRETAVFERSELAGHLAALSVDCLRWPERIVKMLREMGVCTLGEAVRLPRSGLAQRIGPERLLELDRGFGRQPETRAFYRPPKTFHAVQELPVETADCRLLLESLKRLLGSLKKFLIANQGGIQALWLHLHHHEQPATVLRIGLLRPAADTAYLLDLARIRFNDLRFSAPVVSIALQTDLLEADPVPDGDLFGGGRDYEAAALSLMEQLQLRLGAHAVHGIRRVPEHRPELAWQAVSVNDAGLRDPVSSDDRFDHRPLWMLAEPLPLKTVRDKPVFRGSLHLEDGPERIETGWWDGHDIQRDYYIACPASERGDSMRLWIFRDCRESRWYLHGLFG
jgi:protein ImuB